MSAMTGVPIPARVMEIQARIAPLRPRSATTADAASFETALLDATGTVSGASLPRTPTMSASSLLPTSGSWSAAGDVGPVALRYVGVPYVWGGNDPATGLDCSGFTKLVFSQLGVNLPRVSTDQARVGQPVASLAEARPGDLLAFGEPVDHVAIYLGNNTMVHAAGVGKGVRVEEVYRQPTAIRRLLPTDRASTMSSPYASPYASTNAAGASSGAATFDALFAAAGARHGVDPALLSAVARAESGYDPRAVSSAGALGLMQIMPATAAGLGVDPLDPAQAVDGAARYLGEQLRRFGSVELALAAYNAGPGAVARHGGVPPYPETQNYVQKVGAFHAELRRADGGTP